MMVVCVPRLSYHVISWPIMPYHTTSCPVMPYHALSCHIMPYYHAILLHLPCSIMSSPAIRVRLLQPTPLHADCAGLLRMWRGLLPRGRLLAGGGVLHIQPGSHAAPAARCPPPAHHPTHAHRGGVVSAGDVGGCGRRHQQVRKATESNGTSFRALGFSLVLSSLAVKVIFLSV